MFMGSDKMFISCCVSYIIVMFDDVIDEAKRRKDFEKRRVFGEVDGEKCMVKMYLEGEDVVVSCKFGGEFSVGEHTGFYIKHPSSKATESFSSCREARSSFNELIEEYGLSDAPPEEWHKELAQMEEVDEEKVEVTK